VLAIFRAGEGAKLEGKIGVERSEFGKGGLRAIYNFSDMDL
jgi:hypothetical protein